VTPITAALHLIQIEYSVTIAAVEGGAENTASIRIDTLATIHRSTRFTPPLFPELSFTCGVIHRQN